MPRYTYRTIASVHNELSALPSKKSSSSQRIRFNVYGVVLDARAPSTGRGPHVRSEVVLIDESSVCGKLTACKPKTLVVFRFDFDPGKGVPFCSRGDVIRCHRLTLTRFEKNGIMHVQGHAQYYSTFLLWDAESNDSTPIAELGPSRGADTGHHSYNKTDLRRVLKLRKFSREYFSKLPIAARQPGLRTVREVVNAPVDDAFREPIVLLAKYVPSSEESFNGRNVKFRVRDGRRKDDDETILLESVLSPEHKNFGQFGFDSFAYSLRLRMGNKSKTMWMIIHDVTIHRESSTTPRVGQLSVGDHSSTILWLPDYAPEVRALLTPQVAKGNSAIATQRNLSDRIQEDEDEVLEWVKKKRRRVLQKATIIGNHDGKHCTVDLVRQVVLAAKRDDHSLLRVIARVSAWHTPRDLRFATVRFCKSCRDFIQEGAKCIKCGKESDSWSYRVKITLTDEDGSFIHAWIEAEHGNTFFSRTPTELMSSAHEAVQSLKWLKKIADYLTKPDVRLDCLVQPYAVPTKFGLNSPMCRILRTQITFSDQSL